MYTDYNHFWTTLLLLSKYKQLSSLHQWWSNWMWHWHSTAVISEIHLKKKHADIHVAVSASMAILSKRLERQGVFTFRKQTAAQNVSFL